MDNHAEVADKTEDYVWLKVSNQHFQFQIVIILWTVHNDSIIHFDDGVILWGDRQSAQNDSPLAQNSWSAPGYILNWTHCSVGLLWKFTNKQW